MVGGSAEPRREANRPEEKDPRDPAQEAFERALEALARKERTVGELATWLAERGFGSADVDEAVGRLIEVGELDDELFARRFAEDKRELNGWGPERIREALRRRGVAGELVDVALTGDSADEQLARAVALLERRGETPRDDAARARALAYLARRGYDLELAYEAIRRAGRAAA